jgi:hypothetical protein
MRRRISVAEVLAAGVDLTSEEAIAIAQQLIHSSRAALAPRHVETYGPPTAETVFLEIDGSVSCGGCDVTPAVSEVARFLHQLLPENGVRIPGSLRYTIARGLLEVEAPPFDSIGDFSEALSRYERGDRGGLVCRVLDRARGALARPGTAPMPIIDRRRATAETFELRRQLRESDERLYDQQRAIDALVAITASPPKRARVGAIAAGLAIGLTLVGAGELMRSGSSGSPRVPAANVQTTAAAAEEALPDADAPRLEPVAVRDSKPLGSLARAGTTGERDEASSRRATRSGVTSEPAKRSKTTDPRARAHRPREGLLDRLRLGWLRGKIVIRRDDL